MHGRNRWEPELALISLEIVSTEFYFETSTKASNDTAEHSQNPAYFPPWTQIDADLHTFLFVWHALIAIKKQRFKLDVRTTLAQNYLERKYQ